MYFYDYYISSSWVSLTVQKWLIYTEASSFLSSYFFRNNIYSDKGSINNMKEV